MKCLTVVFIALVASVVAEAEWKPITDIQTLFEIRDDCSKETGLTPEQKRNVIRGEFPDEEAVHQFVLCEVKETGVFSEQSGFSVDRLLALFTAFNLDAEKARDGVIKCVDINEQQSSLALWAYLGYNCIDAIKFEKLPKNRQ